MYNNIYSDQLCVAQSLVIKVSSLTPSLVKNSKAARSLFLADSMGVPSFQGRLRVGNPKGSAPKKRLKKKKKDKICSI